MPTPLPKPLLRPQPIPLPEQPTDLAELIRSAIAESDESLNAIAKRAGVDYGNLYRFVHREREHVTLSVAGRLFEALGIVVHRATDSPLDDEARPTA